MNCNECNKVVSYYTHESDMARLERTIHRLWTIIIILIAALVCLCVGFFIYESQFEDTYTTTEGVSQYIDTEGSAIVDGIGNANYGYTDQTNG